MDIAVIIGEIAFVSRSKIMDGIVDAAKKNGDNIILFTCEGFIFHHLKDYSDGEYNIFTLPTFENFDGIIICTVRKGSLFFRREISDTDSF